jgi:hypothetical protein
MKLRIVALAHVGFWVNTGSDGHALDTTVLAQSKYDPV